MKPQNESVAINNTVITSCIFENLYEQGNIWKIQGTVTTVFKNQRF